MLRSKTGPKLSLAIADRQRTLPEEWTPEENHLPDSEESEDREVRHRDFDVRTKDLAERQGLHKGVVADHLLGSDPAMGYGGGLARAAHTDGVPAPAPS